MKYRAVNFVLWLTILALWSVTERKFFHASWLFIAGNVLVGIGVPVIFTLISDRLHKWRLHEMAFQDWAARCFTLAIQRNVTVWVCGEESKVWRRRFEGGLTPGQAVQQELDARDLGQMAEAQRQ